MHRVALLLLPLAGCYLSHERSPEESIADAGPTGDGPVECECVGTPPGPVTFSLASSDVPLRWDTTAGCVQVTYDPALPDEVPAALARAVESWSPSCSRLCFEGPRPETAPELVTEGPLQRIHVWARRFEPPNVGNAEGGVFGRCGGFYWGEIAIPEGEPIDEAALVRSFGVSLGIDRWPDEGTPSVMSRELTAPTSADLAALCAMYGDDGWCGGR